MSRWLSGILLLISLVSAHIQSASPRSAATILTGTVVDDQLRPVAGAALTLEHTGTVATRTVSNADGVYRFAAMAAGEYIVRASAAGFTETTRRVILATAMAEIRLPLVLTRTVAATVPAAIAPAPAPAPPAISVSAAPPVVDTKKTSTGSTFSRNIVESIPSARDPWQIINMQPQPGNVGGSGSGTQVGSGRGGGGGVMPQPREGWSLTPPSNETYTSIDVNRFERTLEHPLSTFGADVDTASYTIARRFLASGQLPPSEAIRVEEFVNYFRFGYAAPRDGKPISLTTEIGDCPWAPSHKLVLVGARAVPPPSREITGRNIVLLIDVSGSMQPAERLPLIKTSLALFVDTLRPDDTLAIVTYAGTSGIALPPTPARERERIQAAIAQLSAGGSTNGASGLIMAYRTARQAFVPGGVNRVILATDGDFNVGVTTQQGLMHLIEQERDSGIFLSVFGVGSGNLKDATMEMLADKGNGNYAYLDSLQEARRVLLREADATLDTVAKDVKFQVEFNPEIVSSWKLIGYEDRHLAARDFNNDRKDAGDMGAGHTVTALYEVIPVGARDDDGDRPGVDPLKYQPSTVKAAVIGTTHSSEWLTVKARYKNTDSDTSQLLSQAVRPTGRVEFLPIASAVAEFGLLLRDTSYDIGRWDALTRRVNSITAPAAIATEFAEMKELIATARGLARIR